MIRGRREAAEIAIGRADRLWSGSGSGRVDVAIVGGGPVGLWLGSELHLAGVSATVLEQAAAPTYYSRGLGVHARTLELLAMRGVVADHLAKGRHLPGVHFGMQAGWLDLSGIDSPFPFMLAIPQRESEILFEQELRAAGGDVRREHRVIGLADHEDGVVVSVEAPDGAYELRARYLVGCDGASSLVRRETGIEYVGESTTATALLADLELAEPPDRPISHQGENGTLLCVPLGPDLWRIVAIDPALEHISRDVPVTLEEVRESTGRIIGHDFGAHSPNWTSRVGNAALQAAEYRRGRRFLAGDAAHIHPPQGGQGLNLGVGDAMNLGWKLAAAVRGWGSEALLDSYHAERQPVGARVIQISQAQQAIVCPRDGEERAVRDLVGEMIGWPEVTARMARRVSGLDIAYPPLDAGDHHPLTGTRVPDLAFEGSEASAFSLLTDGRFHLWGPDVDALVPSTTGLDRHLGVDSVKPAKGSPEPWPELTALLVRPDGYVAWASAERDARALDEEMRVALRHWCGAELSPAST